MKSPHVLNKVPGFVCMSERGKLKKTTDRIFIPFSVMDGDSIRFYVNCRNMKRLCEIILIALHSKLFNIVNYINNVLRNYCSKKIYKNARTKPQTDASMQYKEPLYLGIK